ncbi:hypothetical protein VPUCM_p0110 (plasmid) [Vibrio parahaemolyticus UCM-V493]|nr:hypothetical protein VPUCM_p0110 [Vibrio parahaemolyticus UCM-V493]
MASPSGIVVAGHVIYKVAFKAQIVLVNKLPEGIRINYE